MANLRAVAPTPISLPTCGHLPQIAKTVDTTKTDWSSLKGDRASAYKQLPIDPKYAKFTDVALRHPLTGRWVGVTPKVLLFGHASAVINYICFPRSLAAIISRYFGSTLIIYYDDFGACCPSPLDQKDLTVSPQAATMLGPDLHDRESEFGKKPKFLGLTGGLPPVFRNDSF